MLSGGVKSKTRHYRKLKPKTKIQLYDPSYELQQRELKLMNAVKPTSPMKI